jgi:hypothetical protein
MNNFNKTKIIDQEKHRNGGPFNFLTPIEYLKKMKIAFEN